MHKLFRDFDAGLLHTNINIIRDTNCHIEALYKKSQIEMHMFFHISQLSWHFLAISMSSKGTVFIIIGEYTATDHKRSEDLRVKYTL